uniref:Immunoglobulin V-set domain-containing protein n=1 Tax=Equus asinus TaxID=9793 RepID=A0A9L0IEF3_EQUAS
MLLSKRDPISEHTRLCWYPETLGKGLEFLMYFQDDFASDTSGMLKDQFSAERPKGSSPTLKIQRTEQGDLAVYLCQQLSHSMAPSLPSSPQTLMCYLSSWLPGS